MAATNGQPQLAQASLEDSGGHGHGELSSPYLTCLQVESGDHICQDPKPLKSDEPPLLVPGWLFDKPMLVRFQICFFEL